MSVHDLDPIVHAPKRLAAMAILAHSTTTDFSFLRTHLEVSDSDLSKQMAALERAGYVSVSKSGRGRGATTTFAITASGRQAYQGYLAALRAITDGPPVAAAERTGSVRASLR